MQKNKPLLIFDFDGTIVDSLTLGLKLTNELADKYKYKKIDSLEEIRKHSGINFIKNHIKWYYLPFWLYQLKKNVMNHLEEIVLYPDMKSILKKLSKDFTLGIVGGGPDGYHDKLFELLDIDLFTFVYPNRAHKKEKIIKKIINKNGIHKTIILIGDDTADIKSAKSLGLKTIAVTWGSTEKKVLETVNPDIIIERQIQLYEAIERLEARNEN